MPNDLVTELRTGRGVNEGPMRDAWVHAKMQEDAARIEQLEKALRKWESAMNRLSMRVGLTAQGIADELNPIMDTTRAALDAPSGALEGK